jgi:hypothetical protein
MPNRTSGQNIQNHKLRGEWAELRFMQRATERGFRVTKPWGETAPYDIASACPERATATEGTTTATSSASKSNAPSTSATTPTSALSAPATSSTLQTNSTSSPH